MNILSVVVLFLIAALGAGIFLLFHVFVKSGSGDYKRKRWIVAGVVIVLAALFLAGSGLLRSPIDLSKVERMELYTYDHVREGEVELTQAEQWMVAFLYNISPRGGEITAEPCCAGYVVTAYLSDGRKISVSENGESVMNVRVRDERELDNFRVKCPLLVNYLLVLAEKYDLPIE